MIRRGVKKISQGCFAPFSSRKIDKMKPYKYFLQYAYPPTTFAYLRQNQAIKEGIIDPLCKKIFFINLGMWKMNTDIFHKLFKLQILILYRIKQTHKAAIFLREFRELKMRMLKKNFDYKWSQIYEEHVIIRLIDCLRNTKHIGSWNNKEMTIYFLLNFISENSRLLDELSLLGNVDGFNSKSVFHKYRDNTKGQVSSYLYPRELFTLMDDEFMFTADYNSNYNKTTTQRFSKMKKSQWATIIKNKKEFAQQVHQRQKHLYKNCKITRLDYLSSVEFVLSLGVVNRIMVIEFQLYLKGDIEEKERNISSTTRLLEVMLICKSLEHLIGIKQEFKNSDFPPFIGSVGYKKYMKEYTSYMQAISPKSLIELLTHPANLFPKFLLIHAHDATTSKKLKSINIKIIETVFDSYVNGAIFLDQSILSYFFEILIVYFNEKESDRIFYFMQKYEFLLLTTSYSENNHASIASLSPYLLMVKHGLKSDIIAQDLFYRLEKKLWRSLRQDIKKEEKLSLIKDTYKNFQALYPYYLYLQIVQTEGERVEKVKDYFLQTFLTLENWLYQNRRVNQNATTFFSNSASKKIIKISNIFSKMEYVCFLQDIKKTFKFMKMFLMAAKIMEQRQDGRKIEERMESILKSRILNQQYHSKIQYIASYPQLISTLLQLLTKLEKTPKIHNLMRNMVKKCYEFIDPQDKKSDPTLSLFLESRSPETELIEFGFFEYRKFNISNIHKVLNKDQLQKYYKLFPPSEFQPQNQSEEGIRTTCQTDFENIDVTHLTEDGSTSKRKNTKNVFSPFFTVKIAVEPPKKKQQSPLKRSKEGKITNSFFKKRAEDRASKDASLLSRKESPSNRLKKQERPRFFKRKTVDPGSSGNCQSNLEKKESGKFTKSDVQKKASVEKNNEKSSATKTKKGEERKTNKQRAASDSNTPGNRASKTLKQAPSDYHLFNQ